jgi:hypothetical protein
MKNASRSKSSSANAGLQPGWPDQRGPDKRHGPKDRHAIRHREDQLDDALAQSFPASDPIACYHCN